jgi:hypothetical protein
VFIAVILLVSTTSQLITFPADLILIGDEISSCLLLGGGLIPWKTAPYHTRAINDLRPDSRHSSIAQLQK